MTTDHETALAFFEACETGQGWAGCAPYCLPDAGFSAQVEGLTNVATLEGYADWMQGLLRMLPDGSYRLTAFASDPERSTVVATAVFTGTHTGSEGPVPTTGQRTISDYAYVMKMDAGKVSHVTKIWNAGWALKELGWV